MAPGPDFTGAVNQEWLSRHREEIIEPEFPIVDPNHHLWNRKGRIYLFPQPLEDLSSGHNMRATVFEECGSMAGRCMFESNRPVQKRWCSDSVFWNACKRLAQHASAEEKVTLFSGTAARVNRIPSGLL
jgi:predicted TIM-barrel fold metal-dependent hydrolase